MFFLPPEIVQNRDPSLLLLGNCTAALQPGLKYSQTAEPELQVALGPELHLGSIVFLCPQDRPGRRPPGKKGQWQGFIEAHAVLTWDR